MTRKYRQPGYQDSGGDHRDDRAHPRTRPPASSLTPEERAQRRGLRHAVDREASEVVRCHACGREIQNLGTISPESTCPHCSAELHCCRACQHFDTSARWQCRAAISEPVPDKGKANRCPQFTPRVVLDATGKRTAKAPPTSGPRDAKAMFESLFKR
jgi:hypothetical protein